MLPGPLLKAAHNKVAGFPQRELSDEEMSNKDGDTCHLISEVTFHQFCCILLVTQTNPSSVWEGTTRGCEHQETGHWGLSWRPVSIADHGSRVDHVAVDGLIHKL